MVRFKQRYLLVNILYPPTTPSTDTDTSLREREKEKGIYKDKEFHLQIHRPTPDALTPQLLARMVRATVAEMFGDWGMGKLGGSGAGALNVKYLSPATSTAIIRCPRASYRLVWAALTYMSSLALPTRNKPSAGPTAGEPQQECVFRVVRVSGTMKKAEQEAIRRARMDVVRLTSEWKKGGKDVLENMFGGGADSGGVVATGIESEGEDEEDDESDE